MGGGQKYLAHSLLTNMPPLLKPVEVFSNDDRLLDLSRFETDVTT